MKNKNTLVVKLIVLIVVFLLVLSFAARIVLDGGYRNVFNWGFSGKLALSERFASVQTVEVSMTSASISVEEYDGDEVLVEYYTNVLHTGETPEISCTNGVLSVQERAGTGLSVSLGDGGKVVVKVPRGLVLDYSLTSTSGSIRLAPQSKNAAVSSVSGSVRVWGGGEKLSAVSTSGSIRVYEPFKVLSANSTSGSVRAVADKDGVSAQLASTSGSVKLMLPADCGYSMVFQTVSGSVKDSYRGASFEKSGRTETGDAKLQISIETVSGSIKLGDWNDD